MLLQLSTTASSSSEFLLQSLARLGSLCGPQIGAVVLEELFQVGCMYWTSSCESVHCHSCPDVNAATRTLFYKQVRQNLDSICSVHRQTLISFNSLVFS